MEFTANSFIYFIKFWMSENVDFKFNSKLFLHNKKRYQGLITSSSRETTISFSDVMDIAIYLSQNLFFLE